MKNRYEFSTECRSTEIKERATLLGYANMIMFMCKRSSTFQMRTLDYWLTPAMDHQQITFLFDSAAKPVGFIMWAHLAADTEQRFLNDPNFLLHPSEWNEGGRTWIIDFCFVGSGLKDCISQLKETFRKERIKKIFWAPRHTDSTPSRIRCYTLSD